MRHSSAPPKREWGVRAQRKVCSYIATCFEEPRVALATVVRGDGRIAELGLRNVESDSGIADHDEV